jgi:archaellum biogenesis protein FlaJ (TadC family)
VCIAEFILNLISSMNRDTTIIQVAILMIALAILGVAIWRQQQPVTTATTTTPVKIQEQIRGDDMVITETT